MCKTAMNLLQGCWGNGCIGLFGNYPVGKAQGKGMIAIADVERTSDKGDMSIGQGPHQQFAGAAPGHNVYKWPDVLLPFVFHSPGRLAAGRQDAEMFRPSQDTDLDVDAVDATEKPRLQHLSRTSIGDDAALKQEQAWEIAGREVEIVHGRNHRDAALAVQVLHQFERLYLVFYVQMRGGFV